jgi:small conductance mechanosensitive channel
MFEAFSTYTDKIKEFFQPIADPIFWEGVFEEALFYVFLFTAMFIAQKLVDVFFDRYFKKLHLNAEAKGRTINQKRYNTLSAAFRKLFSVAIWIVAIFIVLAHYDVNYAAILTGAGAVGIFFGIAGKDIIMDLYVGLMVLAEDQYRVGDVVWISADHSGAVEEINLRTVVLRDIDGNVHIVPHSQAQAIKNMTYDFSRVNVEVGVAYDSDIEKVKEVVDSVGTSLVNDEAYREYILKAIHFDRVLSFDESQITIRALGDVKAGKQWEISGVFNVKLKEAFDKNGIEIPFPQRVIRNVEAKPKKPKK